MSPITRDRCGVGTYLSQQPSSEDDINAYARVDRAVTQLWNRRKKGDEEMNKLLHDALDVFKKSTAQLAAEDF